MKSGEDIMVEKAIKFIIKIESFYTFIFNIVNNLKNLFKKYKTTIIFKF
jgi:hypothetical protein